MHAHEGEDSNIAFNPNPYLTANAMKPCISDGKRLS